MDFSKLFFDPSICPTSIPFPGINRDLLTGINRVLWIWSHPAFYEEFKEEVLKVFRAEKKEALEEDPCPNKRRKMEESKEKDVNGKKLETRNVPFLRTPKYISSSVAVTLLKDTLNRFRLVGPESQG